MDVKVLLLFLLLSAIFSISSSAPSSIVFPVQGNVYPLGYYTVKLAIGNPPKVFELDIDTGSDLTWVQCDAPCSGCTIPPHQQYKPHGNLVKCGDPLCNGVQPPPHHHHNNPNEQCDYEVRCGYDQMNPGQSPPSSIGGVLGLGNGKTSILSQLHSLGLIRNVVGHCLSSRGGGFLFFGDNLVPQSGVAWTPILQSSSSSVEQHYRTGPADLYFHGKPTSVNGLELIFDSGSSYTYFNSHSYKAIVELVANDIEGEGKPFKRELSENPTLPVCWTGREPFRSVHDITSNFKALGLGFTKSQTLLILPPQAYLVVTTPGVVCLGILDGTEIGLGNANIIGDISLQDKIPRYRQYKPHDNTVKCGDPLCNCDDPNGQFDCDVEYADQGSSHGVQHYKTRPADLFFNGKSTFVKGLELIFDGGPSYTYFNSQAHTALVQLVTNDIEGEPLCRATDSDLLERSKAFQIST
ncbi:hypothetical protein Fmac_007712 [Flemingia macrophylla]|uniref:Peptidase A1 domain-containing protein n=1 Tax=Flemingia macrophylla TaxID=520843 RepID=A0ABD1MVC3_9FABA